MSEKKYGGHGIAKLGGLRLQFYVEFKGDDPDTMFIDLQGSDEERVPFGVIEDTMKGWATSYDCRHAVMTHNGAPMPPYRRDKILYFGLSTPAQVLEPEPVDEEPDLPKSSTAILLAFTPECVQEAILGDLKERFLNNAAAKGERWARRMYHLDVFSSTWPLFLKWLVDVVVALIKMRAG